jgi:hypothetical protein
MGLHEDIIKLLKADGLKMNEAIRSALDDFVDTVKEENEDFEEDGEDDEDEAEQED